MCLKSTIKSFLLLLGLIIYSSCKKENAVSISRTALLTSGPWKLTAFTFHGDSDGDGIIDPVDKDVYPSEACAKDDLTIYNADGSGIFDQGPYKCNSMPQSYTFSWTFSYPDGSIDESVIKLQNSPFVALSIVELSTTTLKVKDLLPSSSNEFFLFTYSH